ncbi:GNAT family N-acetyltransferase [Actinomycetospora sp. C-140]
MRRRLWSDEDAFGLSRDLSVPFEAPKALVDVHVRSIEERDIPYVLDVDDQQSPEERWDRATRKRLLEAGIGAGQVGVTPDDIPCYTQWIFTASDNANVQRYFGGAFPVMDEDTALLEAAYTPVASRGKRIMSAAMALVAERAHDFGARYAITFVGVDNTASLKGCARAGFEPYLERRQTWRLLRAQTDFRAIDAPSERSEPEVGEPAGRGARRPR